MDTKERILVKAGELFPVIGIRSVTMDFIAQELGISKRTIYELFADKDDLVMQTIEYQIIAGNKSLIEIITKTDNVIEALFTIIESEHAKIITYNPFFLDDLKKYFAKLNASFYANCEKIKEYSVSYALLEKGLREKVFRSELKIEVVDNFLHELINLFHNTGTVRMMKLTKDEALDNILLPYFRGICTRKGQELMDTYFERATNRN